MAGFKDIGAFQEGSGADIGAFESEDVEVTTDNAPFLGANF